MTENVLKVDEIPVFSDSEKSILMSEKSDTFTDWQTVRLTQNTFWHFDDPPYEGDSDSDATCKTPRLFDGRLMFDPGPSLRAFPWWVFIIVFVVSFVIFACINFVN